MELIAQQQLSSTAASVTFSSIPQTYRDLQLVIVNSITGGQGIYSLRFNGDASANYSFVQFFGGASSSATGSNSARIGYQNGNLAINLTHIMDYTATNKHKTILSQDNAANFSNRMSAARWQSNSAITSMTCVIDVGTFAAGSTFTLYGITA